MLVTEQKPPGTQKKVPACSRNRLRGGHLFGTPSPARQRSEAERGTAMFRSRSLSRSVGTIDRLGNSFQDKRMCIQLTTAAWVRPRGRVVVGDIVTLPSFRRTPSPRAGARGRVRSGGADPTGVAQRRQVSTDRPREHERQQSLGVMSHLLAVGHLAVPSPTCHYTHRSCAPGRSPCAGDRRAT